VNLRKKGEKKTYVDDLSYEAEPMESPSSYAEAVIPQCTDLQKLLVSTLSGFVRTDIGRDPIGFDKVIEEMTTDAIKWEYSA
jgi:hypothetical protein